ncbi:MAG: hypothetical protein OXC30_05255 [Alphaproteobacteria bacterium]|nr:hypothetical protein [Alphaproteobacteria bacterium]
MKNIMIICAMIVSQAKSANMLQYDIPERLQRLAKSHVELMTLQTILGRCVQKSLPFHPNLSKNAAAFQTFIDASVQAVDLEFDCLRRAFPLVEQSYFESCEQSDSDDMSECAQMDCSNVEDVWPKLQQSFRSFEILASNQSQNIATILFIISIQSYEVEQDLRKLFWQEYLGDRKLTHWFVYFADNYQFYIANRNAQIRDFAKKFGVDVFESV